MSAPVSAASPAASVWELTALYTGVSGPTDTISPSALYEVGTEGATVPTTKEVFDAWTADRSINGAPYHGPVYNFGTRIVYTGPRACGCPTCQAEVAPEHRMS